MHFYASQGKSPKYIALHTSTLHTCLSPCVVGTQNTCLWLYAVHCRLISANTVCCTLHTCLSQRYLYTLDRRRGGLACPAGWRGYCRLGGEGSWYISKLLLYRQSGRAPLRNTTASVTTEATVLSCSCQSIYTTSQVSAHVWYLNICLWQYAVHYIADVSLRICWYIQMSLAKYAQCLQYIARYGNQYKCVYYKLQCMHVGDLKMKTI